jgi:hypothetical protein
MIRWTLRESRYKDCRQRRERLEGRRRQIPRNPLRQKDERLARSRILLTLAKKQTYSPRVTGNQRHYFHDLNGEQRGFLNEKQKLPFIYNLESTIGSRNGGGDSVFLIDQAELAKDTVGENSFEAEIIDEYVDFSFLDNVHLLPFVSLFENGCPSPKGRGFRSICEDAAESHKIKFPIRVSTVFCCTSSAE